METESPELGCRAKGIQSMLNVHCLLLPRRYSPGWALATFTTRLHCSLFLIFSFHPFTFIFFKSLSTSSSHLILGLPCLLLEYSLPFHIFIGIALSSILSTCPNHLILCDLILLYLLLSVMYLSLHCALFFIYYFPSLVHIFCVLFFSHTFSICSLLLPLRSIFLPHM
jgi:hypothetical protein